MDSRSNNREKPFISLREAEKQQTRAHHNDRDVPDVRKETEHAQKGRVSRDLLKALTGDVTHHLTFPTTCLGSNHFIPRS